MSKKIILILMLAICNINISAQESTPVKPSKIAEYKGYVDLGGAIGVGSYRAGLVDFTTTHGVCLLKDHTGIGSFFIGLGTGIEMFNAQNESLPIVPPIAKKNSTTFSIPVYLSVKLDLTNRPITPFAEVRIGKSIMISDNIYTYDYLGWKDVHDTAIVSLALGYKVYNYKNCALKVALALNWTRLFFKSQKDPATIDKIGLLSTGLRLGVEW